MAQQTQTYNQLFAETSANFISTVLIDPIVNYYKENPGAEITKEKILSILNLPVPQRTTATATNQPLTTAAPKRTRNTRGGADRPRCKWIFTKGVNEGKQCTGYAMENSEYCSACKNKKGAGGSGRKSSNSGGGNKASARADASKPAFTASVKPEAKKPSDEETDYEVGVDDFGEAKDGSTLYLDPGSKFVLKEVDEDTYTVVGFCEDPGSKTMRPLTKAEKEKAKKILGLEVEDGVEMA
jgi:hypothetical protein